MAERPNWVPQDVDVTVPNVARVYDCALGGYHNFGVDREFLRQAEVAWPDLRLIAFVNRAFLGRVVRHLVAAGIRQFLDIGSGIPTVGNVHEVAQAAAPETRVMYVDIDPVAVAHSERMLADNPRARATEGDVRRPAEFLDRPDMAGFLDFGQPIAVLLIAVLHFIDDADDPAAVVARLWERLVPGSYLALSHGSQADSDREQAQRSVRELYRRTPTPFFLRTPDQVAGLLAGLDLVEPGIVPATAWRPDPDDPQPPPQPLLVGLGRVR